MIFLLGIKITLSSILWLLNNPCAYILTNDSRSRFYFGFTTDIKTQMSAHLNNICEDKSWPSECKILVYYEKYMTEHDALFRYAAMKAAREGQIVKCIEKMNPKWRNLYKY